MTRTPARILAILILTGALSVATGCGTGTPPPSGTPTPTASAANASAAAPTVTATPSAFATPTPPPTDPATVFAADGIGPFLIGTPLTELLGRSLVTGLVDSPLCIDSQGAAATGSYAGVISLTFTAGKLASIHTGSDTLVTPSGAKVGMTMAQVQTLYGGRGTLLTSSGGVKSLVVRVTSTTLALVLVFDPTGSRVTSLSGGEADRLETSARSGEGC